MSYIYAKSQRGGYRMHRWKFKGGCALQYAPTTLHDGYQFLSRIIAIDEFWARAYEPKLVTCSINKKAEVPSESFPSQIDGHRHVTRITDGPANAEADGIQRLPHCWQRVVTVAAGTPPLRSGVEVMLVDGPNATTDMSSDSTVTTVAPQQSQDDPVEITEELSMLPTSIEKNNSIYETVAFWAGKALPEVGKPIDENSACVEVGTTHKHLRRGVDLNNFKNYFSSNDITCEEVKSVESTFLLDTSYVRATREPEKKR
ncbi:hypothetical protein TNCV_1222711 [Trichonephila clavipes]|nr:hypothetical protein TNCV_1222711 [Trichonephila clavipes]